MLTITIFYTNQLFNFMVYLLVRGLEFKITCSICLPIPRFYSEESDVVSRRHIFQAAIQLKHYSIVLQSYCSESDLLICLDMCSWFISVQDFCHSRPVDVKWAEQFYCFLLFFFFFFSGVALVSFEDAGIRHR